MLLVETYVKKSTISGAGLGLFAAQFIAKGTRIWEFTQNFDHIIKGEIVQMLPRGQQNFIKTYAYYNSDRNVWILCVDNDRFINHSENPNIQDSIAEFEDGFSIAARDIMKDEELTCNYRLFDAKFSEKI